MMPRPEGLHYIAGGNPPTNPGLFLDDRRIAFWPAGIEPTDVRVQSIWRLWQASNSPGAVFGPIRILDELAAAGLIYREQA